MTDADVPSIFSKALLSFCLAAATPLAAPVTTMGFLNEARPEAPGTLLSYPVANGSEPIGRTTFTATSATDRPPENRTAVLTLTPNALARDTTLVVESTTDFVTWTPLATSINGTPFAGPAAINEGSGTIRGVTITTPAPEVPAFYRARVVAP